MRQGITHMVDWKKEGFEVIGQASNGQEAINIIEDTTPNIVITDVIMPKMDGIELTKYLQANYPNIQIVILSSYSDFDYVKSSFKYGAVDYILKPTLNIDELLKTLKKAASKLEDFQLIYKEGSTDENILSRILLGLESTADSNYINDFSVNDYFCLFGIDTKLLNYDYKSKAKLTDSINYLLSIEFSSDYVIKNISFDDRIILFFINFKKDNYNTLIEKLKKLSNDIFSKHKNTFFIISKTFNSIDNLKYIYENDFLKLNEQSFYCKNSAYIISDDFESPKYNEKFDFKQFSELTSKLEMQNSLDMLTKYIDTTINIKGLNKFEIKTLIQNCFYNIISNLESLNYNLDKLQTLKYKCFNSIEQSLYCEDLLSAYNELRAEFTQIIDEYQNRINSYMINKIIEYINEHYTEQLTLTEVSKLFKFNYYYLSSYFSSHNKEGFNEFVNKIRIENACDFLKKDIPISDISSMVGYSDHSYFCKVFNKFTGVTPSKFRKSSIKI